MATRAHAPASKIAMIKEIGLKTFASWGEDAVPRLAAAFSFYAVLSLAPMLVLAIAVAGMFLGESSTKESILHEVQAALGPDSRTMVETLIDKTTRPGAGTWATLISLAVTFFSASNLFVQLKDTFTAIWGAEPQQAGFLKSMILTRLFAFLGVLVFGGLVLAWLVLDSWLGWVERNTQGFHGGQVLSFLVGMVFVTLVCTVSYRFFPPGKVQWRDVWIGAAISGLGISAGKLLLAQYFARMDVAGAYGPAGALVVILLWIYYTSQIYFFGAEVVYNFAHSYGSRRHLQDNKEVSYS